MSQAESAIAHQFNDAEQQHDASTLGMWIFLVTEVMFFGGLFAGYSVYRAMFPGAWAQGSRLCEVTLGAINTAVLICSSLTMAMAVHSAQTGRRQRTVMFLVSTMLLGGVFLSIKFLEYFHKYREHLIPGTGFAYKGADSPQVQLFICFYFGMTGLHAAPHDHRYWSCNRHHDTGLARPIHAGLSQSNRGCRSLLAFR